MIRSINTVMLETGHRLIMACDLPVVGHSLWIMDFDANGKSLMDWQQLQIPQFLDISKKEFIALKDEEILKDVKKAIKDEIDSNRDSRDSIPELRNYNSEMISRMRCANALYALGFSAIGVSRLIGSLNSYNKPSLNDLMNESIRKHKKEFKSSNHAFLNSVFVGGQSEPINFSFPRSLPDLKEETPNSCKPFNAQKEIRDLGKKLDSAIQSKYPESFAENYSGKTE